jgi:membrane-bound serine protease (ClpP class)
MRTGRARRPLGRLLSAACLGIVAAVLAGAGPATAEPARPFAYSIELNATIDPATERWLDKALDEAGDKHATVAIVRLDTPGGLDTSMRSMIKSIIAAPLPVIVYVSPDGARAASAGLYITEAADVAAMAPQTNIGSATPISIGPGQQDRVLGRKIRNDAAAYVRALAEGHGRNPNLAEQMVRKATNVTAGAAKRARLIDVVAPSESKLLEQLDGFRVKGPKTQTLHTAGLRIVRRDMPFQYDLLEILVNPTVAYLLLLAGMAGIAFEIFNPGIIAPGVLGAVALVLGLFASAQLPVTAAGVILLLVALGLFIADLKVPSHGVLTIAGVLALMASGLLLFDTDSSAFSISVPVALAAGAMLGGFTLFAVSKAVAARHGPVRTGWEELIGESGTVRVPLDPIGQVFVQGALWRARAADPDAELRIGDRVRVESIDGLTLEVRADGGEPVAAESGATERGERA